VGGDPVNFVDPSGEFADYLIDPITTSIGISETNRMFNDGQYIWGAIGAIGCVYDLGATIVPFFPAGAGVMVGSTNRGVTVVLKKMPKWTDKQVKDALFKVDVLNLSKITRISQYSRKKTYQRNKYIQKYGKGSILPNKDIDHAREMQIGGVDELYNYMQLDSSVNRSIGKQIQLRFDELPVGTTVDNFILK